MKSNLVFCIMYVLLSMQLYAQRPATGKANSVPSYLNANAASIEKAFLHPPFHAKPLVYWFWMGSNFTKSGITKDLEAMKEMGIGGGIIVNLTSAVE